ncbi:MAG: hypothetical protein ACREQN_09170 [Candidatus Binataceae bacterium]
MIQYFEGGQIGRTRSGESVPVLSLKEGIIGGTPRKAHKAKRTIVASVERIDDANQEFTLKGSDGSLETIMVTNPEYLKRIKVGDQVVIAHAQGLALFAQQRELIRFWVAFKVTSPRVLRMIRLKPGRTLPLQTRCESESRFEMEIPG